VAKQQAWSRNWRCRHGGEPGSPVCLTRSACASARRKSRNWRRRSVRRRAR
jgi:hypothetical protein